MVEPVASLPERISGLYWNWAGNLGQALDRPKRVEFALRNGKLVSAASSSLNLSDVDVKGRDASISVDAADVAWSEFTMPKGAEEHLEGIIRNKLPKLSPWPVDRVYFGHTAAKTGDGQLQVNVAMLDSTTQQIATVGQYLTDARSVSFVTNRAGKPVELSGLKRAIGGSGPNQRFLYAVLLALTLLVMVNPLLEWGAGYWLDYQGGMLRDRQVAAGNRLKRLRSEKDGSLDKSSQITQLADARPSRLVVLEALARLLPVSTHIEAIEIEDNRLRISGVTDDSALVLKKVAGSPVFENVQFSAPTVRQRGGLKLVFELQAEIAAGQDARDGAAQLLEIGAK